MSIYRHNKRVVGGYINAASSIIFACDHEKPERRHRRLCFSGFHDRYAVVAGRGGFRFLTLVLSMIRSSDWANIARTTGDFPDSMLEKLAAMPIGESAPAGYFTVCQHARFIYKRYLRPFPHAWAGPPAGKARLCQDRVQEKTVGNSPKHRKLPDGKNRVARGTYTVLINNKNEKWKCLPKPFTIKIDGLSSKIPKGKR